MSKYSIIRNGGKTMIQDNETGMYFAGYDPMGGVEWIREITPDCILAQYEDADQIVLDLEAAAEPEEDPVIKSLQTTMDYAWSRREDEHNALEHIRENGPEFMLNKQYAEYRASQAFYEGICMAIFAAGYQIRIDNHETGKSTVCK